MEGIRQAIAEAYENAAPLRQDRIADLMAAHMFSHGSIIMKYGIGETVAFLKHERGKPLDYVVDYILRAVEKHVIDWRQHLTAPAPTINVNVVNVEGDHNTLTVAAPNAPAAAQPTPAIAPVAAPAAADEDPHRFDLGNMLRLMGKLQAHDLWADALRLVNDDLAEKRRGPIDAQRVAFVALLWRKNVKQNAADLGAVPFDAAERFVRRNQKFVSRAPCNRQLAAALSVLEAVGYLKQVRRADEASGRCAAYKLLNEDRWNVAE